MPKAAHSNAPDLYATTGGLGMTAQEMAAITRLTATVEGVRETVERMDSRIGELDARLRSVESNASVRDAIETQRVRIGVESAISRRWVIGLVIAAVFSMVSIIWAIASFVMRS